MTYAILILTIVISVAAFQNQNLFNELKFNAYMVAQKKEWHRLLTHGFLHADYWHLGINMFVLWSFGQAVEAYFMHLQALGEIRFGRLLFVVFYMSAIVIASIKSLLTHKNNSWYNSVGASGAVSAVVFASIFFDPMNKLIIFPIPFALPGIVFGILYLIYTQYMAQRNNDNINHDAHFFGAVYGFFFPLILDPGLWRHFVNALLA